MWIVLAVVAGVVGAATYLTLIATRLDRLSIRVAGAYYTLDAQSVRRVAAVMDLEEIDDSVTQAKIMAKEVFAATKSTRHEAENRLTQAIQRSTSSLSEHDYESLRKASRRLAVSRQLYNGLVQDVRRYERHLVIRIFRLVRKEPLPPFFDIEDPNIDNR